MTPSAVPFMLSHFVTPTEPLLTFGTLEGFLSSVDAEVLFIIAPGEEILIAEFTLMWFNPAEKTSR